MLRQAGYDVTVADGGEAAIETLKSESFDLVVTDLRMRKVDGLAVLTAAKEHSPRTVVLVVTAFASTETAVEAMKLGAYDYVTKPFKLDELKLTIANALERRRLQEENRALKRQLRRERGFENFVGRSPQDARRVRDHPQDRRQRLHRDDHGRERHRQGAGRAGAALGVEPAQRARSCR